MLLAQLLHLALTPAQERLMWLAGSVLLYVSATNGAWALRHFLGRIRWSSAAFIPLGVARFVFHVGLPYAALLSGVVTLKALGLARPSGSASWNQGTLVAVGAVVLIGLLAWHYRREVVLPGRDEHQPPDEAHPWLGRPWDWVTLLVTAVYQQVHWAFYRALPILILDDPYMGGFLGLALVLLEGFSNPRVRHDLADPLKAQFLVVSAGFAVVTTVLFALTVTSWLGIATHLGVIAGWILLVRLRQRFQAPESRPSVR